METASISELPNDIIEYLEKYLKPKRYPLLSKFCRDVYFRKNGVRIRIYKKYRLTELCNRYKVKILEMPDNIENIENIENLRKVATNVNYIKYDACDVSSYILIRSIFPNLKKIKCQLRGKSLTDMLELTAIKGTEIDKFGIGDDEVLEKLALLGYDLIISNYEVVENPILSEVVRNKIVAVPYFYHKMDLNLYPNLKRIIYIPCNTQRLKEIETEIKNHPTMKKIIYNQPIIPYDIIKNNGVMVNHITIKYYNFGINRIINIEEYEKIKTFYNGIDVYSLEDLSMIICLEKLSQNKKRLELYLYLAISHEVINDVLDLFDLILNVSIEMIRDYLLDFKLHKVMANNTVTFVFKIGQRKFRVVEGSYS